MSETSQLETSEYRVDFPTINLSHLRWEDDLPSEEDSWASIKQKATLPFHCKGSTFDLVGVKETGMIGKREKPAEQYQFSITSPAKQSLHEVYFKAEVGFFETEEGWTANEMVQKVKHHNDLRQIGREFWKKILAFIEDFSKTHGKAIHNVEMMLEVGEAIKITQDQWEAIFVPELEQRGYQRIDETHWTKTYGG